MVLPLRKLLGGTSTVNHDPNEEIQNILEDLVINNEPLTLAKFRKVKSFLKTGKDAGPDNIPLEVVTLMIPVSSSLSKP